MTHYRQFHCVYVFSLLLSVPFLIGGVGEEPARLAKGSKVPLAVGDIRDIYQGRWLNDQVQNSLKCMYLCILHKPFHIVQLLKRLLTILCRGWWKRHREKLVYNPSTMHVKYYRIFVQGYCTLSAKIYVKLQFKFYSFLQHHIPVQDAIFYSHIYVDHASFIHLYSAILKTCIQFYFPVASPTIGFSL